MPSLNKAAETLAQGQPVFYVSTRDLSHGRGLALANTWADIIRLGSLVDSMDGSRRGLFGSWPEQ